MVILIQHATRSVKEAFESLFQLIRPYMGGTVELMENLLECVIDWHMDFHVLMCANRAQ